MDHAALRHRLRNYEPVMLVVVDPEFEDHPEVLEPKQIVAEPG